MCVGRCERAFKIPLRSGAERCGSYTHSRETKARTGDDLAASCDWSADAPPNKHRSSPIIAEAPRKVPLGLRKWDGGSRANRHGVWLTTSLLCRQRHYSFSNLFPRSNETSRGASRVLTHKCLVEIFATACGVCCHSSDRDPRIFEKSEREGEKIHIHNAPQGTRAALSPF